MSQNRAQLAAAYLAAHDLLTRELSDDAATALHDALTGFLASPAPAAPPAAPTSSAPGTLPLPPAA